MKSLTTKEIAALNKINTKTKAMGFGTLFSELLESMGPGTPVNAVNAAGVLDVTGVVIDGETVTFDNPLIAGADVYEFCADALQTLTDPGNIAVDITSYVTGSTVTLTIDTQPTSGDTMTLDEKIFTFVPDGTANADGEISIGTDLATAQANIVAAINGTDSVNTPHPTVSAAAFSSNDSVITALVGGVAGDSIASTETFTAGTNVFSAATLGSGADCTAANAITALVAAVTASDTQGVGAADGAGDTVDLTADIAGVAGNNITLAETMANGAFSGAATELAGGVDGTVGHKNQTYVDDTYFYVLIAANTVSGKNWRRISLGTAY